MEYIRQTVRSSELNNIFINLPPSLRGKRLEVIILPAENDDLEDNSESLDYSCNIGFAKGADVPDSFFEPLPEEDLQAWGV